MVVAISQRSNGSRIVGHCGGLTCKDTDVWIRKRDTTKTGVIAKGRVGAHVVDVVALNTFEKHAKAAANNGFAFSGQVIGEADARADSAVVVLDHTSGRTVLTSYDNAVQVKRDVAERYVGNGGEARTVSGKGAGGRIEDARV